MVKISRVERLLESKHAERFLQKVLHPAELQDCRDTSQKLIVEKVASRWAAKEATYKALRLVEFSPLFPEIRVCKRGAVPSLVLEGSTKEAALKAKVGTLHLSLSHDKEADTAIAMVVCEHLEPVWNNPTKDP